MTTMMVGTSQTGPVIFKCDLKYKNPPIEAELKRWFEENNLPLPPHVAQWEGEDQFQWK
jgi:hypothetical protein